MLAAHRIMFLESPLLTAALCLGAIVAGLVAGGVVYLLAWRMTHGSGTLLGRPRCLSCGQPLSATEMIPLFGWATRRGACAHCGAPIGLACLVCELLGAGVFASVLLRYGIGLQALEVLAFACVLMVASLTSLWDYSVRNSCIATAVVVRLAYLLALAARGEGVTELALSSLVGAVALGLPLALAVFLSNAMLARDITGWGTVKLVAVTGLYLGWQQGLLTLAAAFMIGVVVWLVSPTKLLPVEVAGGSEGPHDGTPAEPRVTPRRLRATHEEDIAEPMRLIPFTPSIAIACWGMLLLGVGLAAWSSPLF
ncbi:MAG: prepilin peptidase [Acidobacteriota bacterium]|nr:prepilin peptidase [Acidobacteriota bacterium]